MTSTIRFVLVLFFTTAFSAATHAGFNADCVLKIRQNLVVTLKGRRVHINAGCMLLGNSSPSATPGFFLAIVPWRNGVFRVQVPASAITSVNVSANAEMLYAGVTSYEDISGYIGQAIDPHCHSRNATEAGEAILIGSWLNGYTPSGGWPSVIRGIDFPALLHGAAETDADGEPAIARPRSDTRIASEIPLIGEFLLEVAEIDKREIEDLSSIVADYPSGDLTVDELLALLTASPNHEDALKSLGVELQNDLSHLSSVFDASWHWGDGRPAMRVVREVLERRHSSNALEVASVVLNFCQPADLQSHPKEWTELLSTYGQAPMKNALTSSSRDTRVRACLWMRQTNSDDSDLLTSRREALAELISDSEADLVGCLGSQSFYSEMPNEIIQRLRSDLFSNEVERTWIASEILQSITFPISDSELIERLANSDEALHRCALAIHVGNACNYGNGGLSSPIYINAASRLLSDEQQVVQKALLESFPWYSDKIALPSLPLIHASLDPVNPLRLLSIRFVRDPVVLGRLLGDEDPEVVNAARQAFWHLSPQQKRQLLPRIEFLATRHGNAYVRTTAVALVGGDVRDARAWRTLCRASFDRNADVRCAATQRLVEWGTFSTLHRSSTVRRLCALMVDHDEIVSQTAFEGLQQIEAQMSNDVLRACENAMRRYPARFDNCNWADEVFIRWLCWALRRTEPTAQWYAFPLRMTPTQAIMSVRLVERLARSQATQDRALARLVASRMFGADKMAPSQNLGPVLPLPHPTRRIELEAIWEKSGDTTVECFAEALWSALLENDCQYSSFASKNHFAVLTSLVQIDDSGTPIGEVNAENKEFVTSPSEIASNFELLTLFVGKAIEGESQRFRRALFLLAKTKEGSFDATVTLDDGTLLSKVQNWNGPNRPTDDDWALVKDKQLSDFNDRNFAVYEFWKSENGSVKFVHDAAKEVRARPKLSARDHLDTLDVVDAVAAAIRSEERDQAVKKERK